jgi:hypothetical protein
LLLDWYESCLVRCRWSRELPRDSHQRDACDPEMLTLTGIATEYTASDYGLSTAIHVSQPEFHANKIAERASARKAQ